MCARLGRLGRVAAVAVDTRERELRVDDLDPDLAVRPMAPEAPILVRQCHLGGATSESDADTYQQKRGPACHSLDSVTDKGEVPVW